MNTITNKETQPTILSQQQADLAKVVIVAGAVVMVTGAVTANIPVVVAGGAVTAGGLWLDSMATDNKTTVKLSVGDLVKLKLERQRNVSTSG